MNSRIEKKLGFDKKARILLFCLAVGFSLLWCCGGILAQEFAEDFETNSAPKFEQKKSVNNPLRPTAWFRGAKTKKEKEPEVFHDEDEAVAEVTATSSVPVAMMGSAPRKITPDRPTVTGQYVQTSPTLVASVPPSAVPRVPYQPINGQHQQYHDFDETVPITQHDPHFNDILQRKNHAEDPLPSGFSSYSFDTRDWIECFPVESESGFDSFSSEAVANLVPNGTPVHLPSQTVLAPQQVQSYPPQQAQHAIPPTVPMVMPTASVQQPAVPLSQQVPSQQATSQQAQNPTPPQPIVPAPADAAPKMASAVPPTANAASSKASASKLPRKLEMTPSYAQRLKYTEVCGVVVVQADFPLTEIRSILEEIKQLQRDLNLYMGVPEPREKIELCIFKNDNSYKKFLKEVFPEAPRDRRALYIKKDGRPGTLLVQKSKDFEIDLRHEMTHAVIHASISVVPIWLDEGLAVYFEMPPHERSAGNPYMKQARWNARLNMAPQLNRLEKLEHIGQMTTHEYRDSWSWVHFLIHHSSETHRILAGYLQLLGSVDDSAKSFDVPKLEPFVEKALPNARTLYRVHFQTWSAK